MFASLFVETERERERDVVEKNVIDAAAPLIPSFTTPYFRFTPEIFRRERGEKERPKKEKEEKEKKKKKRQQLRSGSTKIHDTIDIAGRFDRANPAPMRDAIAIFVWWLFSARMSFVYVIILSARCAPVRYYFAGKISRCDRAVSGAACAICTGGFYYRRAICARSAQITKLSTTTFAVHGNMYVT